MLDLLMMAFKLVLDRKIEYNVPSKQKTDKKCSSDRYMGKLSERIDVLVDEVACVL